MMHALSAEQATGALSSEDAVPSRVSEVVGGKVDDDANGSSSPVSDQLEYWNSQL
jgi:hypothetical protein